MTPEELRRKYPGAKNIYIDPRENPHSWKKYKEQTRKRGRTPEERAFPTMFDGKPQRPRGRTPEERAYPDMPTTNPAENPVRRVDDATVAGIMAYPSLHHRYEGWQVEEGDGSVDILFRVVEE